MSSVPALLTALHASPDDDACWLALADALEESGQEAQGELTRLLTWLRRTPQTASSSTQHPERPAREARLQALLASGVRPCVPEVVNSVGMRFALVPPGVFLMGAEASEPGSQPNERPRHRVEISRAFYLGVFPVTQAQYKAVTRGSPSFFKPEQKRVKDDGVVDTGDFPVENVSWDMASSFCERLSARAAEKKAGRAYRLPTEAEWEYSCRAGTTSAYHTGSDEEALGRAAWYRGNSGMRTRPVGLKEPNAFGLFDTHGNAWEWCADWYADFTQEDKKDPQGPQNGAARLLRGGAWDYHPVSCRAAFRDWDGPGSRYSDCGFRVCFRLD